MNVLGVIQARMGSSRFPNKSLAPLGGRPIFAHVVDAARSVVDDVVLVTDTSKEDDVLVEWAAELGIKTASRNNCVIRRFLEAGKHHTHLLRICGDSPFIDVQLAKRLVEDMYLNWDRDYYGYRCSDGTPAILRTWGVFAEGLRTCAIRWALFRGLTEHDKEHVTSVFYGNPDEYKCHWLPVPLELEPHTFKCAIDTIDDLRRARLLKEMVGDEVSWRRILRAVRRNKRLQTREGMQRYERLHHS
jgi:spore coat polysaccharide biosynthesis protein SpsF